MTNSTANRAVLRARRWGAGRIAIATFTAARDLGSHLHAIRATRNATMRARCKRATVVVVRLRYMPVPRTIRANITNGKIYPMALYAAEVTSVPVKEVAILAAAVINLCMPAHATKRSPEIFWSVAATKFISPQMYAA